MVVFNKRSVVIVREFVIQRGQVEDEYQCGNDPQVENIFPLFFFSNNLFLLNRLFDGRLSCFFLRHWDRMCAQK